MFYNVKIAYLKMLKFNTFQGLLLLLLFFCISCTKTKPKQYHLEGNVFGTHFSIHYTDSKRRNFERKFDSLFHLLNKSMSTYLPTSDISRINKGDSTVVVDALFTEVFYKADQIFKETVGVFDPTIGVLVNAWGFGPEDVEEIPDSLEIKHLLGYVGFDKVQLVKGKISKKHPQTYFDFNAIAKGYGVDLVGRFLEQQQITNYLVEIGGELRARGLNAKEGVWKIGIERPHFDHSRSIQKIVFLKNESMATSGNYRKFKIDVDTGEKYVHTIDTKTGYTAKRDLLSATVIAPLDCANVDGYATAFMAMGFDKTKEFLTKHPNLKAFLIYADDSGELKEFFTANF